MNQVKFLFLSLAACLSCCAISYSASLDVSDTPSKRWGVWVAGSDTTPTIFSRVRRQFGIAAIEFSEDIIQDHLLRVEYTCDFIPVLIIHQGVESRPAYFGPGANDQINQRSKSIWGMGLAPIGLRVNIAPNHPVFPFLAFNAGGAYTTEKIPYQVPGGTTLNFLFKMGGGLRWKMSPHQDLLFGYSWWHMSNGRLAVVNPGVDANLWSLTLLFS